MGELVFVLVDWVDVIAAVALSAAPMGRLGGRVFPAGGGCAHIESHGTGPRLVHVRSHILFK